MEWTRCVPGVRAHREASQGKGDHPLAQEPGEEGGLIVIATDFDREGELIGADALSCVREVNATAPVSRARYSAFTKEEITHAFSNLVSMDDCLAQAGASRQDIDLMRARCSRATSRS